MNKGLKKDFFYLLALFSGGLLVLFSAALLTTTYLIEEKVAFQRLLVEAKKLKVDYEKNVSLQPSNTNIEFYLGKSNLPDEFKQQIAKKEFGEITFEVGKSQYYFYHFFIAINQEAYLIAPRDSFKFFEKISKDILYVFLIIIPLTLLLATVIWLKLGRKIVKPLVGLTESIQNANSGPPSIPNTIFHLDNEVGILARNLHRAYQDLHLAIDREREFTRDVSHELRTPIAVILNELSLSDSVVNSASTNTVITEQMKLINNRINVLLAIARAESLQKTHIPLLAVVEESILSIHPLIESKGFKIDVDVPQKFTLLANENLLRLMLTNLIENAVKYASTGQMTIGAKTNQLFVTNQTDTKVDSQILNKRITKGDGMGQGLFLVKRIVDSLGGTVTVKVENGIFSLHIHF